MGKIYLQSFFSKPLGTPISIARYQPKGYSYKQYHKLKPIRRDKTAIRKLPPETYLKDYCNEVIKPNWNDFKDLANKIKASDRDISFMCWCNEKRQQQYSKLFCHTILVGYLFELFDVEVVYLEGRNKPVWTREEFLKEIFDK